MGALLLVTKKGYSDLLRREVGTDLGSNMGLGFPSGRHLDLVVGVTCC